MATENQTIRVGIVGTGFAGRFHYDNLKRVTNVEVDVVGCFSARPESRKRFAEERGIIAFDSFEDMLDQVHVIANCTPGFLHESYTVKSAEAKKHVIVEKPFTGYFGPPDAGDDWSAEEAPKGPMFAEAVASANRMVQAAQENNVKLMYAENWVYAPTVRKEVEILKATKGQILWLIGEEAHSGSGSPFYGFWSKNGGGSLLGKGCHPLSAILYLKRVEGEARAGTPIRPKSVSANMHKITRQEAFIDAGYLRTDYHDVEDFCHVHITFEDGMCADVFASEIVMGGVHNWIEVVANNHRMRCNLSMADNCVLYNPKEEQLADVYLVEKIGTKQGWNFPSPDEDWANGFLAEAQDFMECVAFDRQPLSGGELGLDTVAAMYAAYVSDEQRGATVEIELP